MPDHPIPPFPPASPAPGLCFCGCGRPTPLAAKTRTAAGLTKGQPVRFLPGHNPRRSTPYYIVDHATGCWLWQRAASNGYGRLAYRGHLYYAHRVYYELLRGPIPAGLVLDHLCPNTLCVNPDHLEPVTLAENLRRAYARCPPPPEPSPAPPVSHSALPVLSPSELEAERWLPVPGYELSHAVSDLGRIQRTCPAPHAYKAGHILRPSTSSGYVTYTLSHAGHRRTLKGHSLVALAFLGPRPPGAFVHHIDGDRLNNRLANLMYASPSENTRFAYAAGRLGRGSRHPRARLTPEAVLDIRSNPDALSIKQLAVRHGVGSSAVTAARYGRTWKHL